MLPLNNPQEKWRYPWILVLYWETSGTTTPVRLSTYRRELFELSVSPTNKQLLFLTGYVNTAQAKITIFSLKHLK